MEKQQEHREEAAGRAKKLLEVIASPAFRYNVTLEGDEADDFVARPEPRQTLHSFDLSDGLTATAFRRGACSSAPKTELNARSCMRQLPLMRFCA
jgi:hypothetical protein